MLYISAEETQKGKDNSITNHALIKLLIKWSLRDVSPLSWVEFVQAKTLQPQTALHEQPSEENVAPTNELTEQNTQEVEAENTQENVQETILVQEIAPLPVQET